ncbi:MAG: hypothetical protein AMXMBFR44_5970 [Candidatus Campbellbacteria bacterium]
MTRATQWRIFGTVAIVLFLLAAVRSALPEGSTWVAIGLIAMAITMLWTGREHKLYKMLTVGLSAVVAWLFLSAWSPTAASMKWLSRQFEERLPQDNFDPKSGQPNARAVICNGKVVGKALSEHEFDPDTGCKTVPMTLELLEKLKKLKDSQKSNSASVSHSESGSSRKPLEDSIRCSYCFGTPRNECAFRHDAIIVGPGHAKIRPGRHVTADLYWNLYNKGTWSEEFESDYGTFEWSSADYVDGVFKGVSKSDRYPYRGERIITLTCEGAVPHPSS